MLYQALSVPDGHAPFERSVLDRPDIARYVKDWGRENDFGLVTISEHGRPVGAIWLRLMKGEERGFGYVDDETPELGMAVLPEYRGKGIGTNLLSQLIKAAADVHDYVSLSVAVWNPAIHLYQRLGFEEVGRCGDSVTMRRRLRAS